MKELQTNPKMQEIIKDVQTNGPMSVLKYYSDPDAMGIFSKISKCVPPHVSTAKQAMPLLASGGP